MNIRRRLATIIVIKMLVVGSPVSVVDCGHSASDVLLDESVDKQVLSYID